MNDRGGDGHQTAQRQRLLWVLAAATFVIFFQGFMVAPLIPHLAEYFAAPSRVTGYVVPVYLIPYGFAVLVYGPLSDRWGRKFLVLASLSALIVFSTGTATAQTIGQLIAWRAVTAVGAAAVVPLSLIWIAAALLWFALGELLLAAGAVWFFRRETPQRSASDGRGE